VKKRSNIGRKEHRHKNEKARNDLGTIEKPLGAGSGKQDYQILENERPRRGVGKLNRFGAHRGPIRRADLVSGQGKRDFTER